jgi:succinate dehydrogenase/fumarate reductase cytochrome b subunit
MSMRSRPLSFLHYRWQHTNTLSILHRLTGVGLSIAFVFLVLLIAAVASGPQVWYCHPLRASARAESAHSWVMRVPSSWVTTHWTRRS